MGNGPCVDFEISKCDILKISRWVILCGAYRAPKKDRQDIPGQFDAQRNFTKLWLWELFPQFQMSSQLNVVQTNKPYLMFDGLCNLFMVIWGMVYGIVFTTLCQMMVFHSNL